MVYNGIGIQIGKIVDSDKSSDFGIVISCLKEIEAGFGVEVVGTVSERVQFGNLACGFIKDNGGAVTPRIVLIFYHNRAIIVK